MPQSVRDSFEAGDDGREMEINHDEDEVETDKDQDETDEVKIENAVMQSLLVGFTVNSLDKRSQDICKSRGKIYSFLLYNKLNLLF